MFTRISKIKIFRDESSVIQMIIIDIIEALFSKIILQLKVQLLHGLDLKYQIEK